MSLKDAEVGSLKLLTQIVPQAKWKTLISQNISNVILSLLDTIEAPPPEAPPSSQKEGMDVEDAKSDDLTPRFHPNVIVRCFDLIRTRFSTQKLTSNSEFCTPRQSFPFLSFFPPSISLTLFMLIEDVHKLFYFISMIGSINLTENTINCELYMP